MKKIIKKKNTVIILLLGIPLLLIGMIPFFLIFLMIILPFFTGMFDLVTKSTPFYQARLRNEVREVLVQEFGGKLTDWEMTDYRCTFQDLHNLTACGSEWKHIPTGVIISGPGSPRYVSSAVYGFTNAFTERLIENNYGFVDIIEQTVSEYIPNENIEIRIERAIRGATAMDLTIPTCDWNVEDCNLLLNIGQLRKPTLNMATSLSINIEVPNINSNEINQIFTNIGEIIKELVQNHEQVGEYMLIYVTIQDDSSRIEASWSSKQAIGSLFNNEQVCGAYRFINVYTENGRESRHHNVIDFPCILVEGY